MAATLVVVEVELVSWWLQASPPGFCLSPGDNIHCDGDKNDCDDDENCNANDEYEEY